MQGPEGDACTYLKMHGMQRQQHQGQSGVTPTERLVQTQPTENNTESKLAIRCNALNAYLPIAEKVTRRGTSVW